MSSLGDFPTLHAPGAEVKIKDIYKDFTAEALEQLRNYFTVNPIPVPIGQVQGYAQFKPQAARVDTSESTTSTTYADLATVGPQVTGLPPGKYVLLFGGNVTGLTGGTAYLSVKYGSAEAVDGDARSTGNVGTVFQPIVVLATVTDPNTTIKLRYRDSTGGTATFANRWLLVLRYANA